VQTRGPTLMMGYFKEPEKTAETLTADGWLRTGDIGEIDAAGRLRIIGRLKEQFKTSKGKYVAPAPIENRISTHPAVEACCVTGASLPQPFALLMLNAEAMRALDEPSQQPGLIESLEAHRQAVNAQLDDHEQLDFFCIVAEPWTVEAGFITPTLKVKRPAIEAHYGARFAEWAARKEAVVRA
jgi:long-chain acyl-CoA synthetase